VPAGNTAGPLLLMLMPPAMVKVLSDELLVLLMVSPQAELSEMPPWMVHVALPVIVVQLLVLKAFWMLTTDPLAMFKMTVP
jgi:hypothetical protein